MNQKDIVNKLRTWIDKCNAMMYESSSDVGMQGLKMILLHHMTESWMKEYRDKYGTEEINKLNEFKELILSEFADLKTLNEKEKDDIIKEYRK